MEGVPPNYQFKIEKTYMNDTTFNNYSHWVMGSLEPQKNIIEVGTE